MGERIRPTPTHTYTQQGFFTVRLTGTDNGQHRARATPRRLSGDQPGRNRFVPGTERARRRWR